ncbi:MAG: [Fe-S]-binding protein [Planctomycetes bacterium]|nr:[Fe-S]-binding protein [Planctomycetota bacterium]
MLDYPQMFRVRQTFDAPQVADIAGTVGAELKKLGLERTIRPGQTVAITAGSRGIANIALIIKTTVEHLKSLQAEPFIVPSMGSHGGGTAEGQVEILRGYNVTPEYCGCPIRASMETVVVCQADEGFPIHFDKHASTADHVLVCGRVKPHTGFVGDIESGLMKMMLIGLGKHNGAIIYHRAIQNYSFGQILRSVAGQVLKRCRIVAGLAIVENPYDQTALIEAVAPQDFESRERELLKLAAAWLPRLPFERTDVLLIDEIGKNISGTGLDPNVVYRKRMTPAAGEPGGRGNVRRIIVRALTEATHGNATGIGLADYVLKRAVEQADMEVTKINCITGGHPEAARLPLSFATDRGAIDAAMATIGLVDPIDARVCWIHNTLHLVEAECSVAYLAEARERKDLEIIVPPRPLPLDATGNLPPPGSHWGAGH